MPFNFETVSAIDYDELRPGYAPEAAAWVAREAHLREGSVVVDLAAGTGQLSRRFLDLGMRVVAVEPARNMRDVISNTLPGVRVLDGVAEAIPLGDAEADTVVVGNAFHHFDERAALAEIGRVLDPGGALALFWARSNLEGDPALAEIERTVEETVDRARDAPAFVHAYRAWGDPSHRTLDGFAAVERRAFPTTQALSSARLADLFATSSDVASLPEPQRAALLERVRELSRDLPATLEIPGRSVVDLFVRD